MKKLFATILAVMIVFGMLSACAEADTTAHTHVWDRGTYVTEQTCAASGEKQFTCTACGETKTETVPPHHWYNGVLTTQPGASVSEMCYTCCYCGEEKLVAVEPGTIGDINEDAVVDMLDIIDLMEWYCSGVIEVNLANADMTGDAYVDMLDVIALMQWYCGTGTDEPMPEEYNPVEIDRAITTKLESHWVGNWTLANAWIGEEFIDDYGVEGAEAGLIEVKPGVITMTIEALLNHCAADKSLGQIVDYGAYLHAHVYCLSGTIAFADYPDEAYTIKSEWDEFAFVVRGEMDGDFNYGPAKTHIEGDDQLMHWTDITGIDYVYQEEIKYIFMNTSGQLVLCFAEKNLTKEKNNTVGFAYIFDKVVE